MRFTCLLAPMSALLLTACAYDPSPYLVVPGGTLPATRYADFDRIAAATPVQVLRRGASPEFRFQPRWIYAVDPGFQAKDTVLQVGRFTGEAGLAAELAEALPARLAQELGDAHLFASVTTTPVPGSVVLTGTVTRAGTLNFGLSGARVTQVEARLTRGGSVIGAMQVTVAQPMIGAAAPLISLIVTAFDASRIENLAGKFRSIFEAIASGRNEGLDPDTGLRGLVMVPLERIPEFKIHAAPPAR